MKLSISFLIIAACSAPPGDRVAESAQPISVNSEAVLYNTPGPQYGPDGGLLGTHENPFTIVQQAVFADVTHAEAWAIDPSDGSYGTFHQPLTLEGTLQYKWVRCGSPRAGC